jgi:two-component system NtrC family sensor kinase
VVRATQAGKDERIGPIVSRDEIGELARQFDRMLDQLGQRNQQIKKAAEELELKVAERTRELRDKNTRLQQTIDLLQRTRQQLIVAEKLAALGELTAGVAHEINNPVAVILGNMDVLVQALGAGAEPVKTEIDLIIEQIYRIRAIVGKLLQYSRPTELAGGTEDVDVAHVIDDALLLVKHELNRKAITVRKTYQPGLRVTIGRPELQQVLINLLINAAHAVDVGGRIELEIRSWDEEGVVIAVRDDGVGIPKDRLGKVFDPFFTTKNDGGTGLGLSVSYGIINSYGGTIGVESELGQGTTFEIYLYREPKGQPRVESGVVAGSYLA